VQIGEPRIIKVCDGTVDLEWDPPQYASMGAVARPPVQYKVAVAIMDAAGATGPLDVSHLVRMSSETRATVHNMAPGFKYSISVATRRHARRDQDSWHINAMAEIFMISSMIDPSNLIITPETSTESCDSIELMLPSLPDDPYDCYPSDFLSVEWRTARVSEAWQPLLDRVDRGDLPKNVLVVDELGAYEAFEFRVHMHHLALGGSGGEVVAGPGTGTLLVGMLKRELVNAPTANASSSASVAIHLPEVSHCREGLSRLIYYARGPADADNAWQPLPEAGVVRDGNTVYANMLRCPDGCRFRWSTDDVKGWEDASLASTMVTTPKLPSKGPLHQRLELKLGAHVAESPPNEEWRQTFGDELAAALGLAPSSIDVPEVRIEGEYVTFDLPRPLQAADGSSTPLPPSPAAALVELMTQPACANNLALHQPGRCSSNCGNGTSPAHVNDGDQRQYSPHLWQASNHDHRPWWAVQIPQTVNRPFVRVLVGDCCAQSFRQSIDVHIGLESGPTGADKCASLVVQAGSAVGAFCEGEGNWITVTSSSSFTLAEVQVCYASDVNPLFHGTLTRTVDTSAGLMEVRVDDMQYEQLVPTLLSLVEPGRDAAWRLPMGHSGILGLMLKAVVLPSVGGLALLALVVCSLRRVFLQGSFVRVSRSDGQDGLE
jgi:hypothetical protein